MSLALTARFFCYEPTEMIIHRLDQVLADVGSGMTARGG
jgi:hypothetical protein